MHGIYHLLFLQLLNGNAKVVHSFLEAWRVKVQVDSLELSQLADVRYVIVVFYLGVLLCCLDLFYGIDMDLPCLLSFLLSS